MRKKVKEALDTYQEELQRRMGQPWAIEVIPESYPGADAWVHVHASEDQVEEVLGIIADLTWEWDERYGVYILATVSGKGLVSVS